MKIMRLPKISFRNPLKNKVVIFDNQGGDILEMALLGSINHTIVHCRREVFHVTPPLLFLMLKNSLRFLIKMKNLDLDGVAKISFFGKIYKIYLLSCIHYIKPRVVLTFIDNNLNFHWLSRVVQGCEFYAIQNGIRCDAKRLNLENTKHKKRLNFFQGNVMSMPHFFCFGEYETDLYRKQGHAVDNFYMVGSLKGGYYKTQLAKEYIKIDFDICLVSDQVLPVSTSNSLTDFDLGVRNLHKLVCRYIAERGSSCCIAMRALSPVEREIEMKYFTQIFGENVTFIERDDNKLSSYSSVDRSLVSVSFNSTVTFEAFGWGKKILFCNLGGDEAYQLPLPDICICNDNDYEIFSCKLDALRKLDDVEYEKTTQTHAKYLMSYDFEKPAHNVIRKMILENLN